MQRIFIKLCGRKSRSLRSYGFTRGLSETDRTSDRYKMKDWMKVRGIEQIMSKFYELGRHRAWRPSSKGKSKPASPGCTCRVG